MTGHIVRTLSRRAFAGMALASGAGLAACGNGVGGTGAATIDARVEATLRELFNMYPNTREIAQRSAGMLVMPLMTEAGFGFGGAYGRGALMINGKTVDYYSAIQGSWGLQIGAQQYAHVLFFMTHEALMNFRRGSGWAVGADVGYVLSTTGDSIETDSNRLNQPVLAAVFGQAGAMVGASLAGTKYTRIIP